MCQPPGVPGCAYCDALKLLELGFAAAIVPIEHPETGEPVTWLQRVPIKVEELSPDLTTGDGPAYLAAALCTRAYADFAEYGHEVADE